MAASRRQLSLVQKTRLMEDVLDEFKMITWKMSPKLKEQLEKLPKEIKSSLVGRPIALYNGISLFDCYKIYKLIVAYIDDNNVSESEDALGLWTSKDFWADLIYRTYRLSGKGHHEHAFYLQKVIFENREVTRFRSAEKRRVARLRKEQALQERLKQKEEASGKKMGDGDPEDPAMTRSNVSNLNSYCNNGSTSVAFLSLEIIMLIYFIYHFLIVTGRFHSPGRLL